MNIAFDEAREYFLKRIKTLEKRLYHADKRGNETEIADLRKKLKRCREAVRALGQPEVVRCKDCAHYGGITFGNICRRWSALNIKNCTKPDDYCSYGIRKDGDGECLNT